MLRQSQQFGDIRIDNLLTRFESTLTRIETTLQKVVEKQQQAPSMEQINNIQSDISMLPSKQQVDLLQEEIVNISRIQSHLQKKQDQLASKQDLLHSTIANERQKIISIMSSPLSPPLSSWNQPFRSISSFAELPSKPKHQSAPPVVSTQSSVVQEQQPICIDDDLSSILDDISSFGPSSPIRSSSFSEPLGGPSAAVNAILPT